MKKNRVKDIIKGLTESHHKTKDLYKDYEGEDKSFKTEPEKQLKMLQQYEYKEERWVPISFEQLMDTKLGYFLDDDKRLLLKAEYKKQVIFIVNNRLDYESTRLKYPESIVIDFADLLRFWTGHIALSEGNDPILKVIPTVVDVIKIFPGTKVEKYIDRKESIQLQ